MKIKQLTIIGGSPQKTSKQKEPGGLYPLGKRPVNNQLCRSINLCSNQRLKPDILSTAYIPRLALAFQSNSIVFVLLRCS